MSKNITHSSNSRSKEIEDPKRSKSSKIQRDRRSKEIEYPKRSNIRRGRRSEKIKDPKRSKILRPRHPKTKIIKNDSRNLKYHHSSHIFIIDTYNRSFSCGCWRLWSKKDLFKNGGANNKNKHCNQDDKEDSLYSTEFPCIFLLILIWSLFLRIWKIWRFSSHYNSFDTIPYILKFICW